MTSIHAVLEPVAVALEVAGVAVIVGATILATFVLHPRRAPPRREDGL